MVIDWWLSFWTSAAGREVTVFGYVFPNQYDGIQAQIPSILVYVGLIVFMFVFLVARTQWALHGGVRASRRGTFIVHCVLTFPVCIRSLAQFFFLLHSFQVFSNMTHRVLHAPMSYFDTTPLGRIINRFSE